MGPIRRVSSAGARLSSTQHRVDVRSWGVCTPPPPLPRPHQWPSPRPQAAGSSTQMHKSNEYWWTNFPPGEGSVFGLCHGTSSTRNNHSSSNESLLTSPLHISSRWHWQGGGEKKLHQPPQKKNFVAVGEIFFHRPLHWPCTGMSSLSDLVTLHRVHPGIRINPE